MQVLLRGIDARPLIGLKKFVLECSTLKKIPAIALGSVNPARTEFFVQKAQHTDDPSLILNDLPSSISIRDTKRYPFVLVLDEIVSAS